MPSVLSPSLLAWMVQVPVFGSLVVKVPSVPLVPLMTVLPLVMTRALPAGAVMVRVGRVASSTVSMASWTLLAAMWVLLLS